MQASSAAVLEPPPTAPRPIRPAAAMLTPSAPTGAVSFGPVRGITALASSMPARPHRAALRPVRLARAIAVTSGKGGVGKSNIAVNLAAALGTRGLKVCLIDGDLGLANADILCNLSPRLTLEHVMTGRCRLADVMLPAPGGFRLIPGASGVARLADLGHESRHTLLQQLMALEHVADVLIIDCGAGINANVVGFAAAANTVIVTTTPEPTSLTDGYAMVKLLLTQSASHHNRVEVVVNMVESEREAAAVFHRLERVSQTFLKQAPQYGGAIPQDDEVVQAVRARIPFVLCAPDSPAARAIHRLADKLMGDEPDAEAEQLAELNRPGFFVRFASWLGLVEIEG
jgi:flagellar biosynthesis protein FlhG